MPDARQVVVESVDREITIFDKSGKEIHIGNILSEDYQSEVKRFSFQASKNNPWANSAKKADKPYSIGSGSKHLSFINPADAQRILLDQGYIIKQQFATMGGLQAQTIFIHPDHPYEDSIMHDRALMPGRDSMLNIWPAVILDTNLTIGRVAARYVEAMYRQWCTNGMGGPILNLNELALRHTDWESDDVAIRVEEEIGMVKSLPLGPVVGSGRSVKMAINLLNRYNDGVHSDKPMNAAVKFLEDKFTTLSPNVLRGWALDNYISHLNALAAKIGDTEDVHALQLLNAYTSGVNQYRLQNHSDRGTLQALNVADAVVNLTSTFSTFAELFSAN